MAGNARVAGDRGHRRKALSGPLFTEDLARAYFLRSEHIQDCDLLEFWQWEYNEPLRIVQYEGSSARPDDADCDSFPTEEIFDYAFSNGETPYGRIVATVRDWKIPGTRRRILDEIWALEEIAEAQDAQKLLTALEKATDPSRRRGTMDLGEAKRKVFVILEEEISSAYQKVIFSELADIAKPKTEELKYRIKDESTGWIVEALYPEGREGKAILQVVPSWTGIIQGESLVESMLNVRGILELFSHAMRALVLVLAGGTALLLAISHVLRKQRDIGVLLANGASPRSLFAIYVGEILIMTLAGSGAGLVLAYIVVPWIEAPAYEIIERVTGTALGESRWDETDWSLKLNLMTAAKAAALVVIPAFLASTVPVWAAARTEPLRSLDRGI